MGDLANLGVFGLLVVLVTIGLGAYFLGSGARRLPLALALSLAPLLLGFIGSAFGRGQVERVLAASPGQASPMERERGERQADRSTWLGAGGTLLLVFLAAGRAAMRAPE